MKYVRSVYGFTGAAVGAAMLTSLSAPSAEAGYVIDLAQVGADVVATGSGAIDLTGLTFVYSPPGSGFGLITPAEVLEPPLPPLPGGTIGIGFGAGDLYDGATGPVNFGSGGNTLASSGSGDPVGISSPFLGVPQGYVSDSPLSSSSTWDNATFSSLGVTPGRYEWTWGTGADQNFTLVVGSAVPEPSTWAMMLLGFAGLGWAAHRGRVYARTSGTEA